MNIASHAYRLLLFATLGLVCAAPPSVLAEVSAPRQIEGVLFQADPAYQDASRLLGDPLVIVDLGVDGGTTLDRDALRSWTVIGTKGAVRGSLLEFRKTCEYLCGDELEECHYVALISISKPLPALGDPVAAFAGEVALADYQSMKADLTTETVPGAWLEGEFHESVWRPRADVNPGEHRLAKNDQGVAGIFTRYSEHTFHTPMRDCKLEQFGELSTLSCLDFASVIDDGRVLLASMADYNAPAAALRATFLLDGRRIYVVQLALKAQTVFGVLYESESGWKALFMPRKHALLC